MLQVEKLSVSYGGIHAVREASLEAKAGEVTVIIGRNGSGKSSFVNGIAGFVKSRGSIRLDGQELTGRPPWKRARSGIALVPEDRRIFGDLTVRENLELAGPRSRSDTKLLLDRVLETFPALPPLLDRSGNRISGGQQQMVAIGRGLMRSPRMLILDEPSLGLAPLIVDEVFETIRRVSAEGQAVLLIEQNALAALRIAASAYAMSSGVLQPVSVDLAGAGAKKLLDLYL